MPSAVSLAWTGMPYSRSSRHTWHTFFAFATSWQMMVALYLLQDEAASAPVQDMESGLPLWSCQGHIKQTVLIRYSPCPWTWTPAEFGVWAARDVALGSVLEALHADVGIGP